MLVSRRTLGCKSPADAHDARFGPHLKLQTTLPMPMMLVSRRTSDWKSPADAHEARFGPHLKLQTTLLMPMMLVLRAALQAARVLLMLMMLGLGRT